MKYIISIFLCLLSLQGIAQLKANAGTDQITYVGDTVHLDARASTGHITTWHWTRTSGQTGYKFSGEWGSTAAMWGMSAGLYVFDIATYDAAINKIDHDEVAVTVRGKPPISIGTGIGKEIGAAKVLKTYTIELMSDSTFQVKR